MKEKNNIDNLFKTGISGFTVEPSNQVWQKVESGFFGKKGVVSYKWYYIGAALFLLLLSSGGILYFGTDVSTWGFSSVEKVVHFNKDIHSTRIEVAPFSYSDAGDPGQISESNSTNSSKEKDFRANEINNADPGDDDEANASLNSNDQSFNKPEKISPNQYYPADNEIHLKGSEQSVSQYASELNMGNIIPLRSLTIDGNYSCEAKIIDPEKVIGLEAYLEKQRKSHFYTAASFNAGMVYYPATKDQFTWSADLSFGITTGKFYVETGIGYQDIQERGIYAIDLRSFDSVGYYNEVESFEIDPQNPGQIIYNTNKVSVYDSIDHYTHTTPLFRYKYLNIPAIVGYQFLQKQNFSVSLNTGILFSLLIEKDIPVTEYHDPDFTTVNIHNNTPERVEWNLRWQLAVRLNYTLYKSISVSAEPNFTKYINSIYDTDIGYDHVKPYTMSIRIGIYYGF